VNLLRRRALWRGALAASSITVVLVAAAVPMPFLELAPGPTFNVIGAANGQDLIQISGTPTYPTAGNLDMTTVNERGGPDSGVLTGRVLAGWWDPSVRVLPREAFYPEDISGDQVKAENVRQFSDSEADAIAAALTYLKRPVRTIVVVSAVTDGTPADGRLEPGDQIVELDGHVVRSVDDVGTAMSAVKPGETVKLRIARGDGQQVVDVPTIESPVKPGRAYMGIAVGETYRALFDISVHLDGVGGPSAGMMLSLGIIDKLTPGMLNGGKHIAGTGTITRDGEVGPIGGIEQKLSGARNAGATLFLAPESNCADVVAGSVPDGLTIAKVATLTDAVNAVEAYVAGRPVTPCS
jgi:PDZ domain-containing protein